MLKQTTGQATGRHGERWLVSQLPTNWIIQPPKEDVGVDGVIVIADETPANGIEFKVQVKTSRSFKRSQNHIIISGIKRSSLLYWFTSLSPVMLVAYETSSDSGFYGWIGQIVTLAEVESCRTATFTLRIPIGNTLIATRWPDIATNVVKHHSDIAETVNTASRCVILFETIKALLENSRALNMGHSPDEIPREVIDRNEFLAHNDFLFSVGLCHSYCEPGMPLTQVLEAFHDQYLADVRTFMDLDLRLLDYDDGSTAFFNNEKREHLRSLLIEANLDLAHRLLEIVMHETPAWREKAFHPRHNRIRKEYFEKPPEQRRKLRRELGTNLKKHQQ
jgi:hypothetical protein